MTIDNIVRLGEHLVQENEKLEELSAKFEQQKRYVDFLSEVLIPELMQAEELSEISFQDGGKLTVREKIRASVSKENESDFYQWLEETGQSGIAKKVFSVNLENDDSEELKAELKKVVELAQAAGNEYNLKQAVHHATLSALAGEMARKGKKIPECITVWLQQSTVIK